MPGAHGHHEHRNLLPERFCRHPAKPVPAVRTGGWVTDISTLTECPIIQDHRGLHTVTDRRVAGALGSVHEGT